MPAAIPVPPKVRALFPASANRTILVANAWHPSRSTLERPPSGGWDDGFEHIGKIATREVIEDLKARGFTWVNLEASGVAHKHKDIEISRLL